MWACWSRAWDGIIHENQVYRALGSKLWWNSLIIISLNTSWIWAHYQVNSWVHASLRGKEENFFQQFPPRGCELVCRWGTSPKGIWSKNTQILEICKKDSMCTRNTKMREGCSFPNSIEFLRSPSFRVRSLASALKQRHINWADTCVYKNSPELKIIQNNRSLFPCLFIYSFYWCFLQWENGRTPSEMPHWDFWASELLPYQADITELVLGCNPFHAWD